MNRELLIAKYLIIDIRPWLKKRNISYHKSPVSPKVLSGICDNVLNGNYTEGKGREIIQTILEAFELLGAET